MDGIIKKDTLINADGPWELLSTSSWLTVTPTYGNDDTMVSLSVDVADLSPGQYAGNFVVYVSESNQEHFIPVMFSFPRLTGQVVKEEKALLTSQHNSLPLQEGPGRLLVGLADTGRQQLSPQSALTFEDRARRLTDTARGAVLKSSHPNVGVAVYDVTDRRAAAARFLAIPHVRYVEQDMQMELLGVNDPYRSYQWALDAVGADHAWTLNSGQKARIAIIDSGFAPAHPDLFGKVTFTYDFGDDQSSIVTSNSSCGTHGTHVAGIAAAEGNNSTGIVGVGYDASLLLLDVDKAAEAGCPIYASSLISALDWLSGGGQEAARAEIVNVSLGIGTDLQSIHDAITLAHNAGITIVAAAGNDPNADVMFPAKYSEVIAVSATGPADEIASYSSTGPEIWLSAPGGHYSLKNSASDMILSTIRNSSGYTYDYMQGTSMASPLVAGVAGLIKATNMDLSPRDISEILASSSKDLGTTGRDDTFGYGRLDAASAAELARNWIPNTATYLLHSSDGRVATIPADGQFDLGYINKGSIKLEAFTDDNGNRVPGETGEFYGWEEHVVEFDGAEDQVIITVRQQ